jgi:hypothetical protein
MKNTLGIGLALLVGGCVGVKAPATDDFSDLAGADEKSDSFSSRMKIVGTLVHDQSINVSYNSRPRYRAVRMNAKPGPVAFRVTSKYGDPVTWVLDSSFKVLASNDDISSDDTDSYLETTSPDGNGLYVVFRDYSYEAHYFTVSFETPKPKAPAPISCATGTRSALAACAESNYDNLANTDNGFDALPDVPRADMPAGVRRWFDAFNAKWPGPHATVKAIPTGDTTTYAVWFDLEESFWAYLVDGNGNFLSVGTSGDSCCGTNGWSHSMTPQQDPFSCTCGAASATQCEFC